MCFSGYRVDDSCIRAKQRPLFDKHDSLDPRREPRRVGEKSVGLRRWPPSGLPPAAAAGDAQLHRHSRLGRHSGVDRDCRLPCVPVRTIDRDFGGPSEGPCDGSLVGPYG